MSSSTSDSEEFYDAVNELPSGQRIFRSKLSTNIPIHSSSPENASRDTQSSTLISFGQLSESEQIDSPHARRRRLRFLRNKMIDEFESNDASGEIGPSHSNRILAGNISALETISDVSSLASWGKHFLKEENLRSGGDVPVVKAADSVSTKAGPFSNDSLAKCVAESTDGQVASTSQSVIASSHADVSSATNVTNVVNPTDGQAYGRTLNAPVPCQISSLPSSVNHSSGSSKSSTMERFITPESKTSSLDRRAAAGMNNIVRCLNKKSSSLNREVGGLSACEHLLYDNAHLAALERKNSAAAELIENLTSEFVKNARLERNSLQKGSEPLSAPVLPSNASCSSSFVTSKENFAVASSSSIRASNKVKMEPDIVSSNRVKENANVENKTNFFIESPPSKPPRRKKIGKDNTLPLHSPPNPLKSSTISANFKSAPTSSKSSQDSTLDCEKRDTLRPSLIKRSNAVDPSLDDNLPKCDPLSLHMLRLTNDLNRLESHQSESGSGTDDISSLTSLGSSRNYLIQARLKTMQYRKMIGRSFGRAVNKTVRKMKNVAEGVRYRFHTDETNQSDEDDNSDNSKFIRVRSSHKHKGPYHFEQVRLVQNLKGEHSGSVWCLKFSHCGRLLATGGQDNLIRVWILKDAFNYFNEMRSRYNADDSVPLYEQLQKCTVGLSSVPNPTDSCRSSLSGDILSSDMASTTSSIGQDDSSSPFVAKPFCVYRGHSADVLDLSWSKNYFVLSSSMDRTVRLWHISRAECLCCFQHIDFVTAIVFLPKDDRYFLSGSLDGKLRLWHIPEKKVALWNEVEGGKLVTTLTFARNGKFAVVGTYDGRCIFYTTDQLKYHTQIDVKSGHGKNSRPHKITGLESFQDKLLVTSNDSRIRLYDLRDLSLTCKYKGYTNYSSQIRATFSHDGKFIICGSEDKNIYIWKTNVDSDVLSLPPVRKDRNRMWESIRERIFACKNFLGRSLHGAKGLVQKTLLKSNLSLAHNAVVTAAIFAPRPDVVFHQIYLAKKRLAAESGGINSEKSNKPTTSAAVVTAAAASSAIGRDSSFSKENSSNFSQFIKNEAKKLSSHLSSLKRQNSIVNNAKSFTGEILVSADFSGAIYVFLNRAKIKAGSSTFLLSY